MASLNATIEGVWVDYKPVWTTVFEEIEWQFNQIRSIDDNEWNIPDDENSQEFWVIWENAMDYLRISVINSVFGNFKIDAIQDLVDSGEGDNLDLHEMNAKAYEATTARFYLVVSIPTLDSRASFRKRATQSLRLVPVLTRPDFFINSSNTSSPAPAWPSSP